MTSRNVLALTMIFLFGCNGQNATKVDINIKKPRPLETRLDSVEVINDRIVIRGQGFSTISKVELNGTGTSGNFKVESVTATQIVAYASSAARIAVGASLNLLIGNAEAQSTYQISFDLDDQSVTSQKIHHMSATSGQVLRFNGTNWVPGSLPASQLFLGAFDADNNVPDLTAPSNTPGDYYIVSNAGNFGGTNYDVGDWIISDGSNWQKIANPQPMVHSFQGRIGAVTLVPGDYVSLKNPVTQKLPGSSLGDLADINLTGLTANKILKYDGTQWVVTDDISGGGPGSVGTADLQNNSVTYPKLNLADGVVPTAKVTGLDTSLTNLGTSVATKITRTDLTAISPLSYNNGTGAFGISAATTSADGSMSASDKSKLNNLEILPAGNGIFERFAGSVRSMACSGGEVLKWNGVTGWSCDSDDATDSTKLPLAGGTLTGDLALDTKLLLKDGVSSNYVTLKAPASGTTSYTLTLPGTAGTSGQVLSTNGSGVTSWSTVATSSTSVGGDLSGTIASATISNSTINSAKIVDGAIVDADVNSSAAIAQSKIANLTTDLSTINSSLSTINTSLAGKIGLTSLSASAPLSYNNTTGAFTIAASSSSDAGSMSSADKIKIDSVTATELGYVSGVTSGVQTQLDAKLPLAGGTLTGDLTLDSQLRLKDGVANTYVIHRAPTSGTTSYTLTWPGTVGANGQVLTTNASGILSWSTVATTSTSVGGDLTGTISSATIANSSVNSAKIADGAIVDADINASAAIAQSKILNLTSDLSTITTNVSGKIGLAALSSTAPLVYNNTTGAFSITAATTSDAGSMSAADKTKLDFVSATELGYVAGVTSGVQTQLDAKLPLAGGSVSGDLTLESQLKLKDGVANTYVIHRAPASGTTSYTLTWPGAVGINGQVLTTNASGVLSWTTVATSATSVGGDLTGTISSATIANSAVNSAKIADGAIVDADVNASAAIAQSKIAGLTTDLSTITSNVANKIELNSLSATAPLIYNNTTGAFTVSAATTTDAGTLSAADKTKLNGLEALSAGNGLFERFAGSIRSVACTGGEVLKWSGVTGWTCGSDNATDATKLPLAGGTLTGDLTLDSQLLLKDGASSNYVTLKAPASGTTSYTLTLPNGAGTTGQVLTTNGSGITTWSTVATSSTSVGGDLTGTIATATIGNGAVNSAKIADGAIVDADISSSAAIVQSKVANLTTDLSAINSSLTSINTSLAGKIGLTSLSAMAPLSYNNTTGAFTISAATTSAPGSLSAADKTKLDSVSATELGYVAGVTSGVQTQLDAKLPLAGGSVSGDLTLESQLKLKDGAANTYVIHRAPASGTTSYTLTWPGAVGSSGQVLTTNASGVLSWTTVATSATSVGGDLTGTISSATIANSAVSSAKIADGAIVDADVNSSAAIAQSKIANLTSDLSTITTNVANKIELTSLSATAPLIYSNTTGAFTVSAATTTDAGTLSASDKTKLNGLEALSAGNGLFERFSGSIRSVACTGGEVLKWSGVTGWTCGTDNATDASKLPLAGGTLTGDLTLDTQLLLKDGASSNYITVKAPTSGTTSYTLTLPNGAGTTGQVLTTNGSGVTSWSTVATSSTSVGGDLTGTIATATIGSSVVTSAKIADGAIVDADVNASAAIAQSKIASLTTDLSTINSSLTSINTSLSGKIGLTALSASAPLSYNNTTGAFSVSAATTSAPGSMSAADKTKLDSVSATELGYVSGVTSGVQTQLDGKLPLAGGSVSGDLTLDTQLKLKDGAANTYVIHRAPASGTTSHTLTWPGALGTNGQVLTTNASGVLSWTTVATSSTSVGGDLTGTISSATIANSAVNSAKIADGAIVDADVNASAAIAQSKIANLTTDLSTISTNVASKIELTSLSATAPLFYDNATGAFTINAATTAVPGTLSASDKTKLNGLETLSAGNGLFERFAGSIRSVACSGGEVLKWSGVTGWTCGSDNATDASKLPLTGGTLTGDLTVDTQLLFKDGASSNYVTLKAPASGTTSYTLTWPGTVGANGQVLTTNASGVLSWTTVATSSTSVGGDLTGTIASATIGNSVVTSAKIADGAIVDADINASAAIAQSKIASLTTDLSTINSSLTSINTSLSGKIGLTSLSASAPLSYNNTTGAFSIAAATSVVSGSMSAADKTKLDSVTATELGYVAGVTSGVQTQLDARLSLAGGSVSGDLILDTQLKLKDGAANTYVIHRAPASGTTSYTLTWPGAVGAIGQVLTTNASGVLSWTTVATSSTSVGGDLSGTISSATIANSAVNSAKIADGAIVDADVNASAAIAQTKIAGLTTDLSTITTNVSGKIGLTSLSATAPLVYSNTTGVFTVSAATTTDAGTLSAADKTKLNGLETLSAGNGLFERFAGSIRSVACSGGEVLKWSGVTGWTCGSDNATDSSKLPLAGGTLTGDLTVDTQILFKDGASSNYVTLKAPASGTTSYTLTWPGTVGAAGQVLTTNASGVLSWTTVATSSTSVGGDLTGTIASATIGSSAVTSAKIADGAIVDADVNASAAIAQSKIASLTTDLSTINSSLTSINTSLSGKIGLTSLSASAPLSYNNTTGAFSIAAATSVVSGSMSAADKTKLDSVSATELGYVAGVTSGVQTQLNAKLPLAGGSLSGDLTLDTQLKLKDGAANTYVIHRAPASGTTSHTLTWPGALGTNGQVLTTNASGVLSWTTVATSSTSVGGDLTGTISAATIGSSTVNSAKIADGAIVDADVNASAAIAQTKIANLTTDLSTITTNVSGKIGLTSLSATAPLVYDNTTGAFTVSAATTTDAGTLSASDKTKLNGLEALSAGNGLFERFAGSVRSVACTGGEVLKWNGVTGWTCGTDNATDATKLPLAGGTLTGDLTLNTQLLLKDGASSNYVTVKAPASGTTSYTLTLPNGAGTTGQVLTTNGSGVTSWSTVATSSTSVGGDLTGTISSATIGSSTVNSAKIADGAIVDADINASAAIAQSKIASLTTDLSTINSSLTTINTSLAGKIGLTALSASTPLSYNNTTGAFSVSTATTSAPGTMSAADKTKLDSVTAAELGYVAGVTSGVQTQLDARLPLAGGSLSGDLTLDTQLKLKDGAANTYVIHRAPASGTTSYTLTWPGALGTNGQVLTTNASGVLSWTTVATSATSVGGDLSGTISSATIANSAVNSAKIADGAIVDADVNSSAAIAQSKIANLTTDLSTITTNVSGKIALTSLSASAPLVYSNTTGAFTVSAATITDAGTLSAADKTKLNGLEALSAGSGLFERFSGSIRSNTCPSGEVLSWNAVSGWTCTVIANGAIGTISATNSAITTGDGITTAFNKAQGQINVKADLASPALTGTPTAPTAVAGTSTTQIATTAFVANGIQNYSVLVSDVTNSNLTANTIADVTGLSFTVAANVTYEFEFFIVFTSAATATGSRWAINGPATTFIHYDSTYALTTTSFSNNPGVSAYNTPAASNATSAATGSNTVFMKGVIRPSAAGTIIARFASEVSSSAIVAKGGRSYVKWKAID